MVLFNNINIFVGKNNNVLYKYCDQIGIAKILESLELKVPFVSEVNDPLECMPVIYFKGNKSEIIRIQKANLNVINKILTEESKRNILESYKKGDLQTNLKDSARQTQEKFNKEQACLLSVSETAQNTVMWAHYAEKHKGGVIGIDFSQLLKYKNKIQEAEMHRVKYSKKRPKLNAMMNTHDKSGLKECFITLMTKSYDWKYEREQRSLIDVDALKSLQKLDLACFKDFNGQGTWFLRLNPQAIKEVVFGLFAEDNWRAAIRKLLENPSLRHVKLYQIEESGTYTFNLRPLD